MLKPKTSAGTDIECMLRPLVSNSVGLSWSTLEQPMSLMLISISSFGLHQAARKRS